ncbi:MAG: hypothetical protein KBD57_09305 [Bacteroidia bacterium]|nr:hypothetical protein [Bacteroidia bacterium]
MKYYFETEDAEMCYPESYFQDNMKELDLTEMEVFKAKIKFGTDYFWCNEFFEVGEVGESCGKQCSDYKPNNGKNGRCKHYRFLYENTGEKVTLKLKP